MRILVVDSDPLYRRLCQRVLQNHEVDTVATYRQVGAWTGDLILVDTRQGGKGVGVCAKRGRVIVLSAKQPSVAELVAARNAGAVDYAIKPLNEAGIAALLRQWGGSGNGA